MPYRRLGEGLSEYEERLDRKAEALEDLYEMVGKERCEAREITRYVLHIELVSMVIMIVISLFSVAVGVALFPTPTPQIEECICADQTTITVQQESQYTMADEEVENVSVPLP